MTRTSDTSGGAVREAAALFGSGLFEQEQDPTAQVRPTDPDHDFRFGLETILDGVAAAVERAAGR